MKPYRRHFSASKKRQIRGLLKRNERLWIKFCALSHSYRSLKWRCNIAEGRVRYYENINHAFIFCRGVALGALITGAFVWVVTLT